MDANELSNFPEGGSYMQKRMPCLVRRMDAPPSVGCFLVLS
jgi:hypothetical protein